MMTKDELLRLLGRIADRTASVEEIAQYNRWCDGFRRQHIEIPDMEAIKSGMLSHIHQQIAVGTLVWRLPIRRVVVAAAAVTAITLGIWLYYASSINSRHPEFISGSPLANDVSPGKNTATLTLANGRVISLSDAKTGVVVGDRLAYNDGSMVATLSPSGREGVAREGNNNNNPLSLQGGSLPEGERSRVQMLIASTPRGGTYQVILPDGTRVWLNADSKISFPSKFVGNKREILLLSGEVYFEVAKDKKHPFIVKNEGQQIEVLGTHFNVNAYPDEGSIRTTLIEGSVRVAFGSLPAGERSIVLKPNQQSTLTDKAIDVKQVDVTEAIAWKDGVFRFDNVPLEVIMRQLARWYDIEVTYQGTVGKETYNGVIDRKANLSRILKILEKGGVSFKIEGKRLRVIS